MALSAGALLVCLQILLSLSSRVRAVPTFRVVENSGGGVGRLNETQGSNYRYAQINVHRKTALTLVVHLAPSLLILYLQVH